MPLIRSRSAALARREHADVIADAQVGVLVDQPGVPAYAAIREHVVQHDRVDAAKRKVAVRMHVVFVGDGDDAVLGLGGGENVVGQRGAERRHTAAAEIGQRSESLAIRRPDRQDLAELVVWNGDGQPGATGGAVFDAAQPDIEVASARQPHRGS